MSTCATLAYGILAGVGFVFSCFYGWYGVTVHVSHGAQLDTPRSPRNIPPRHWSWWLHQFSVNFLGSAAGWAAAIYLIHYRVPYWSSKFDLSDAFLVLLALLGIMGFLPWRLFNASLK